MAVPRAVKKQADEAQRLFEQRNGDPERVETPEPPPADQIPEPQKVETDPQTAPVEAKPENWELRYRNYKAGTDETIHQLRQENAALRGEVSTLKDSMEGQRDKAPAQSGFLSDEEREEYGDLADIIERVAKQMVERELAPTRQKVESIAERSAETERERFEDGLTRRVKDWKVINEDPRFIAWLNEVDDFSGQPRTTLIHHAAASRDIERVAAFFNAFKELPGGTPPARAQRDPKEREFPGTHRGDGEPPASGQKRTYSNDEIRVLYEQKRRGFYQGRDQEWRAIEADISAAVAEGRIR